MENKKIEMNAIADIGMKKNDDHFVSLTNIAVAFGGNSGLIEKWLRNSNTIQYLGIWETVNNPIFNQENYQVIFNEVGTNRFIMSVKKWIEMTSAIGIAARAGRHGGTYAQKEIALDFASWLNPSFKLQLMSQLIENTTNNNKSIFDEFFVTPDLKKSTSCYLYLMQDLATKLYKIGISKNITYREKTLQSQKPVIFLLFHKLFENRQEAFALEQKIHKEYSEKRIRGEWFNFSSLELQKVEQIFFHPIEQIVNWVNTNQ